MNMKAIFLKNFNFSVIKNNNYLYTYIYNNTYFIVIKNNNTNILCLCSVRSLMLKIKDVFKKVSIKNVLRCFVTQFIKYKTCKIKFAGKGYKIKSSYKNNILSNSKKSKAKTKIINKRNT